MSQRRLNFLIKYHALTLCFYSFSAGFLTNAVVRRVTQPVWPSDTIYPITLLGLTIFSMLMQAIVLNCNMQNCSLEKSEK